MPLPWEGDDIIITRAATPVANIFLRAIILTPFKKIERKLASPSYSMMKPELTVN
jgi:hypothetical protein